MDRLMTPADCLTTIIRPALQALAPFIAYTEADEQVILGIALQESGLRYTHQLGGGPALGLWEMEPATHDDSWRNFLLYRRPLANAIGALSVPSWTWMKSIISWPHAEQLETNHKYACAMARVKLFRSPEPMPQLGDIAGYARIWKTVYNTAGGAGTEAEFMANWESASMA